MSDTNNYQATNNVRRFTTQAKFDAMTKTDIPAGTEYEIVGSAEDALKDLVGSTRIGKDDSGIYWNGSKFVEANNIVGVQKGYKHHITLTITGTNYTVYYKILSSDKDKYTLTTLPASYQDLMDSFIVFVTGGGYTNVSGMVYRDGEGVAKILLHGIISSDASTTTYLNLPGTAIATVIDETEAITYTAKSEEPFYNLIEKVITGYTALTAEPEDFATNYANYYKTNGKARNDKDFNYVALTEAETFEAGKFYSYIDEASSLTRNGDSGKEPDGTAYSFKNLYIYGETKDTSTYFADYGWAYFYINNSLLLRDASFVYFSSPSSKSHRGELFANVQGNSFRGYTTSLSNTEDNGSKINYSSMKFRDTEVTLTGISMSKLPAGTTILIYGVRK